MSAAPLPLEWHEEPGRVRDGVYECWLMHCDCGKRIAVGNYSRKENEAEARRLLVQHRERFCPRRGVLHEKD